MFGGGALRVGTSVFQLFEETVRSRTTELAARRLRIRTGVAGLPRGRHRRRPSSPIEQLFGPESVGLWIENGSPIGHAAPLQRLPRPCERLTYVPEALKSADEG